MRMAVDDGIIRSLRHILLIIYMSVGQQVSLAVIHEQGVGFHDREIEQHLIDFCITVATYGDNLVCQTIEALHDALRVDALRNAVAGTIVDGKETS